MFSQAFSQGLALEEGGSAFGGRGLPLEGGVCLWREVVCLGREGSAFGGRWSAFGGRVCLWREVVCLWRRGYAFRGGSAWKGQNPFIEICQDTVNRRSVRILFIRKVLYVITNHVFVDCRHSCRTLLGTSRLTHCVFQEPTQPDHWRQETWQGRSRRESYYLL